MFTYFVIFRLKKTRTEVTGEASARQLEINAIGHSINIKFKAFDSVNSQLTHLIEAAGGQEIDPVEAKLNAMEKKTAELDAEIREAQGFWLRLQGHVVTLSEKRSDQLNSIQLTRKRQYYHIFL